MTTITDHTLSKHEGGRITPADVARLFDDGYREVEILPDGTVRQVPDGDAGEETFTRTLKTQRTWY